MDPRSSLSKGKLRKLTSAEKFFYPNYSHVTTSESSYKREDRTIKIPSGYLTYILPCVEGYENSWVFYDYLYTTHMFTSGQYCSRQQANSVIEEIVSLNNSAKCWILMNLIKFDLFWIFSRSWENKKRDKIQFLIYETKKYR